MGDDFDLRALVCDVVDNIDSPDPTVIAKEVNRRIDGTDRDAALEQSLRVFVQHCISRTRYWTAPGGHDLGGNQEVAAAGGTGTSSWKVPGIRAKWAALRKPIAIGTALDGYQWKYLGKCTTPDLTNAAEIRDAHARRNAARAEQFRQLAQLLAEHDVATVEQLPEDVLEKTFGGTSW
jgi:hypothetical protein